MDWRYALLRQVGPGLLGGITFGKWMRLLRENRFAVSPSCLLRALSITAQSCQNSWLHGRERRQFESRYKDVVVPPPLFVLGHWRHGTTHLHNLLTVDQRFAYPNTYQCLFPETFLTAESFQSRVMDYFLPKRRPMDNIEWTMQSPQEDEFALCVSCFKSPCMSSVFPQRQKHYEKYLTLRDVSPTEVAEWQKSLLLFFKKLTWKFQRPLILKSPPHTCKIKLLLQMFPQAKFVHIHRHPYAVFPSCIKTFLITSDMHRLQRPRLSDLNDWILRQYRQMYDAFFEERSLIPAGQYHEIGYEDLEQDPLVEVQRLYATLDLPDFAHVEPALRSYVGSIAGYQKNTFPALPEELRLRIANDWRPSFEEWGYTA